MRCMSAVRMCWYPVNAWSTANEKKACFWIWYENEPCDAVREIRKWKKHIFLLFEHAHHSLTHSLTHSLALSHTHVANIKNKYAHTQRRWIKNKIKIGRWKMCLRVARAKKKKVCKKGSKLECDFFMFTIHSLYYYHRIFWRFSGAAIF